MIVVRKVELIKKYFSTLFLYAIKEMLGKIKLVKEDAIGRKLLIIIHPKQLKQYFYLLCLYKSKSNIQKRYHRRDLIRNARIVY